MTDQQLTGAGEDRAEASSAFHQQMRSEENERREFAEAFARETSPASHVTELIEAQRRSADRIANLQQTVAGMRRRVLVANLLSGAVATLLLVIGVVVFLRPQWVRSATGIGASDTVTAGRQTPESVPDLAFESDRIFEIRTDIDRKYQLIIRRLYFAARRIRRPTGPVEVRNAATADYIEYMAEVSRVIEQAAGEQVSPEIMQAIINLSMLGPELRQAEVRADWSVRTQNRIDQIEAVLRARDLRSTDFRGEAFLEDAGTPR